MWRALPILILPMACLSSDPKPAATDLGPISDPETTQDGGPSTDTGGLPATGTVRLGDIHSCPTPLAAPEYEEVGLALGIDPDAFDPAAPGGHEDGPSLALADVNNDGYLELVIGRLEAGDSRFYVGGALGFTERSGMMPPGRSPLFVDINVDGILDLMMGGIRPYQIHLSASLDGSAVDLPDLDPPGVASASTAHDFALADFDGDGIEDVYVVRTATPHGTGAVTNDRMFHLYPEGIVVEMDAIPESVGLRHGFDGLPFDEDGDGDMDIYLVHDHGATVGASTLLRNDDGVFIDARDTCFCELYASAKGIDITDIDRDGEPDVLISGSPMNTLLSRKAGSWVDISEASNFRADPGNGAGWGAVFLDVDNDGAKDILLAQGDRWSPGMADSTLPDGNPASFDVPLRLLRQSDGLFTEIGPQLGIDTLGSFRAVVATDMNSDGIEDLVVTQVWGRTLLFMSKGCTVNNWITIDAPLGAKVSVRTASGTQTDWSRADRGLQSTARVPLHFGLGADTEVLEIIAQLPGGGRIVAPGPIAPRRRVDLRP